MIIKEIFKASATSSIKSLLLFIDFLSHPYAIKLYADKILMDEIHTPNGKKIYLLNLPYFLAGRLEDYARWLMATYTSE